MNNLICVIATAGIILILFQLLVKFDVLIWWPSLLNKKIYVMFSMIITNATNTAIGADILLAWENISEGWVFVPK